MTGSTIGNSTDRPAAQKPQLSIRIFLREIAIIRRQKKMSHYAVTPGSIKTESSSPPARVVFCPSVTQGAPHWEITAPAPHSQAVENEEMTSSTWRKAFSSWFYTSIRNRTIISFAQGSPRRQHLETKELWCVSCSYGHRLAAGEQICRLDNVF